MKIIGIEDKMPKRKLNKKKVMIAGIVAVVVLIFLILFIIYSANKSFRNVIDKYVLMKNVVEDSTKAISLDENESNNIFAYDKYISVLSKNVLKNYNSSGKLEGELTIEISNPITATSGKFLLIAEKGQSKIYLLSGNEIIWQKELEGNVDNLSVNKNGYVAVMLSGTTYKSVIETYDASGEQLFKTYLSNTTAMDAEISLDNQYLAFTEMNTSGTLVQSIVKIVSIKKAKTTPTESIIYTYAEPNGNLITNIKYEDSNRLVCMYDDGIYIIRNENNEKVLNLVEEDKKISFGDIEVSGHMYRVIEKSSLLSTETTVEIMGVGSKSISNYVFDGVAKEMYSYNDTIAINVGSEVHFISTNGWLKKKYISSHEIKNIVLCNSFAGIIYRDKIEIVEI